MTDDLLNEILKKHGCYCDKSKIKIKFVNQYPHVFIICFPTYNLFVKKINKDKMNCQNLDILYQKLSNNKYIELPKKTIDDKFCFYHNEEIVIVYKELSNTKTRPTSQWWSNCLSSIHNTEIEDISFLPSKLSLEEETFNLLNSVNNTFDSLLKHKINTLLNSFDDFKNDSKKLCLSHSDPYDDNVMQYKGEYKLIDTDGMRLLPKEFDIQRLLHSYVNCFSNDKELLSFWHSFLDNYEKQINGKVNIKLLKHIYVYDIIRVLSWLSIVCTDETRLDLKRQKEQLKLYKDSFIEEKHLKVLKKI